LKAKDNKNFGPHHKVFGYRPILDQFTLYYYNDLYWCTLMEWATWEKVFLVHTLKSARHKKYMKNQKYFGYINTNREEKNNNILDQW